MFISTRLRFNSPSSRFASPAPRFAIMSSATSLFSAKSHLLTVSPKLPPEFGCEMFRLPVVPLRDSPRQVSNRRRYTRTSLPSSSASRYRRAVPRYPCEIYARTLRKLRRRTKACPFAFPRWRPTRSRNRPAGRRHRQRRARHATGVRSIMRPPSIRVAGSYTRCPAFGFHRRRQKMREIKRYSSWSPILLLKEAGWCCYEASRCFASIA